ncbi:MAG: DNA replication and repair protein RecF [candidate division WOR-3 bacterium]
MIKKISLVGFRNFKNFDFEFSNGVNLITGPNGSGKTNILEAIAYISQGKSFRRASDKDLTNFDSNFFRISATIVKDGTSHEIIAGFDANLGSKYILIDDKQIDKIGNLFSLVPSLISTDRDQDIVDGPPSERRSILNRLISIIHREYLDLLIDYRKILENKNILLKEQKISEIKPWNEKQEQLALRITEYRLNFIEKIKKLFIEKSAYFLKGKKAELIFEPSYDGNIPLDSFISQELRLGFSIVGPHRDNIEFTIDGKPARIFASEGEKRLMILAFYFTFLELFKPDSIVLLDEPFSVLDERGCEVVLSSLKNQSFITAPQIVGNRPKGNVISL